MILSTRSSPPRLSNFFNNCSANCIIQILFNDPDCWNMITKINDNDPLKQLAIRFNKITNGNRAINLADLYDVFKPIIDVKNEEKTLHPDEDIRKIHIDPLHIFEKILNEYSFIKEYFRNSDDLVNYTQVISIADDSKSVQLGLNKRIDENLDEFTTAPNCMCIQVVRTIFENQIITRKNQIRSQISNKVIEPNKYIHYLPINTDIDQYYAFYAMIMHHNNNANSGHFEVLLYVDDQFYQCNDTHVTRYLKNEISDATLKKKSYIFFYKKLNEIPDDYNENTIISPPRKQKNNDLSQNFDEYFEDIHSDDQNNYESTRNIHSQRTTEELFPVTALNRKTIPMFIPYNLSTNIKNIPDDLIIDDVALQSFRPIDKNENNSIKLDIHDTYKYLNGFLDVAPGISPKSEYSTSKPNYIYTQHILEVFTEILCNLNYISDSSSNGEINSMLTAQKLNIEIDSPLELQIKEMGEALYNLFKDYDNKKPKIVKSNIESDIVSIIQDLIVHSINENGDIIPDHKKSSNFQNEIEYPDQNYDWEKRIDEYGIKQILVEIKKKNNDNDQDSIIINSKDKLRQKLWKDFLSKKSQIKNKKRFIAEWVHSRTAAVTEGAIFISESRSYQLLNEFIKNKGVTSCKKHTGAPSKFTDEARLCLLATVMDFPTLTDQQRTQYLNDFGPCKEKNVSVRLVNDELSKLNITIKKPCFSEPQRNSIGYRIARYIWAKIMLEITDQRNALFVFIDEAGVQKSQPNSSRGFVSIRPLVNGTTKNNNIASILAAVIPGYGTISRWFKGSVTNKEYALFLREVSFILRTEIANQSTQIIIIQDNAAIHKTEEVRNIALKYNLNTFFIVPYSPHLNEVAENYFGQMKYACIFDHEFAGRSDFSEGINGTTKYQFIDEEEIMTRWNEMTKQKYSGVSALSIFQGWITILKECIEGKPLTGQKFSRSDVPNTQMNNIQCYRKIIF